MAHIKPPRLIQREKSFQIQFYAPDGRRRRLSAGTEPFIAQQALHKVNAWLWEGKDPEVELERLQQCARARSMKLRDFYTVFMERYGGHRQPSTQRRFATFYNGICRYPALADAPIGSITRSLVEEYRTVRLNQDFFRGQPLTPATVNRDIAFLKVMLQRAVVWEYLDRNPLQGFEMLPEHNKRDVDLTPEQVAALAAKLTPSMGNIVRFAVYTGLRCENILGLKIEDVTMFDIREHTGAAGQVRLVVKGGRQETFPLGEHAMDILRQEITDRRSGYVFINWRNGDRYRCISKPFREAVQELGLTAWQNGQRVPLRYHDLRHVFATWLHQRGITLDVIRNLLGHKSRETTDRYASFDRIAAGSVLQLLPLAQIDTKEAQPGGLLCQQTG